jgi:aminoglycoside phosphotransferase family enzyme/predicted kinase
MAPSPVGGPGAGESAIDLDELRRPACYPDAPERVEIVQTHISIVCLAGPRVYKLKKPVRLSFLDFSTRERRAHFCHEEVRLNRRLCPDVYRGVAELRRGREGLNFRGDGPVVDHAVEMTRLPADRMLDRLLAEGRVRSDEIAALARRIAAFHAAAERGAEVRAAGAPDGLAARMRANFADTRAMIGPVFDGGLHAALEEATERDVARLLPILARRAAAGRVVDGHGDLHARNVCLTDPPAVYDCIEFSAAFRCGDVAVENAFLTMDLRYRGHRELRAAYVDAYVAASGDDEQPELLPPLERYRAMVRAKVGALASAEPEVDSSDRVAAVASARRHARLAAALAIEEGGALWVAVAGPPASGKSALARAVAGVTGSPVLSSDRLRKEILGITPTVRAPAAAYAPAVSDRVYATLLRRAAGAGPVVLLDANWPTRARRAALAAAARDAGARVVVAALDVSPAIARRRLAERAAEPHAVSDADLAVYERLAAAFERPAADEGMALARLDGAADIESLVDVVLAWLVATAPAAR